jgi:hypothetical protein
VHEVGAQGAHVGCQALRVGQRPAAVHPVGGRHAQAYRAAEYLAHGLENALGVGRAAFVAAAPHVVALVGQWRQELVQQIAMRGVQLDGVYARARSPLRCRHESGFDARQVVLGECMRCWFGREVRQGRGRAGHPTAFVS